MTSFLVNISASFCAALILIHLSRHRGFKKDLGTLTAFYATMSGGDISFDEEWFVWGRDGWTKPSHLKKITVKADTVRLAADKGPIEIRGCVFTEHKDDPIGCARSIAIEIANSVFSWYTIRYRARGTWFGEHWPIRNFWDWYYPDIDVDILCMNPKIDEEIEAEIVEAIGISSSVSPFSKITIPWDTKLNVSQFDWESIRRINCPNNCWWMKRGRK